MNKCCDKRASIEARHALWVVLVLNALTFAIKITASLAVFDTLRDAALYGIGLVLVVSPLRRRSVKLQPNGTNEGRDSSLVPSCSHC